MLADVEKRVFLGESVVEETRQMKELSRYPHHRFCIGLTVPSLDYVCLR